MSTNQRGQGPDDVPRSPTGRVPQWVKDEAGGTSQEPESRRPPKRPRNRRPTRSWLRGNTQSNLLAAAILLGAVAWTMTGHGVLGGSSQPSESPAGATPTDTAARRSPLPGTGVARAPRGTPPVVTTPSSSYRFLMLQPLSKEPVAWDPCRVIHYVVRPDNAPAGGLALVQRAAATVSRATGLRLVYDGPTAETPKEDRDAYQPDRYGDRWAPVLVTWATTSEVPDFDDDVAGQAGPTRVRRPGNGAYVYVSGQVSFDAKGARTRMRHGDRAEQEAIVLHEFGHLVGLGHADVGTQLMWAQARTQVQTFRAGDLTGLAALGGGQCARDV